MTIAEAIAVRTCEMWMRSPTFRAMCPKPLRRLILHALAERDNVPPW